MRLVLPPNHLSDNPSGPITAIVLRMAPALDQLNTHGTVLISPSGPGASGTEFMSRLGEHISMILNLFNVLGSIPAESG